jgi:hypothetical protein
MSHLTQPPEDELHLARPLWEKPPSPDSKGAGSASSDPEGELHFARPRGNGFDRTRRRDVGPSGSHKMKGRAGGQTSSTGAGKDVARHDSWKGRAISASPDRPPHWSSSRKTHRGLTPPVLSGRTSPTKHAKEPMPPALLRCTSHVTPGSVTKTPYHHLQG